MISHLFLEGVELVHEVLAEQPMPQDLDVPLQQFDLTTIRQHPMQLPYLDTRTYERNENCNNAQ